MELEKLPRSVQAKNNKSSGFISKTIKFVFGNIFAGPARAPDQKPAHDGRSSGRLADAVIHLQEAAQKGNLDAIYILAEMNFYGYYNHPRDFHNAFRLYKTLASDHGNATAQYMLGLYYSTGVGNVVPRDQAKALLYYNFAAVQGYIKAEMATGFRYHAGIGAAKSCDTALKYYKSVADKTMEWYRMAPPGGRSWVQEAWQVSDEDGGIYGEGASASSAGLNAYRASLQAEGLDTIEDMIDYLDLMSQKGDMKASFNLGRLYYEGQRGLPPNHALASKYFFTVSAKYWKKELRSAEPIKPIDKIAAKVAGYIGRMYMRGEGVNQSYEKAKAWFDRGKTYGDAQSQYGLGLMLLNGLGVEQNVKLAIALFRSAADQNSTPARVQLGRLFLDQGEEEDFRLASTNFELAAAYGNIEAYYYLGEMAFHGVGQERERMCSIALHNYKVVVEKAEPLVSSWHEANEAYEAGAYDLAYLHYLSTAEQGYEAAQNNLAYMLDTQRDRTSWWIKLQGPARSLLLTNSEQALVYWTRSSRQSNVDATVKMGDYYYYGIGADADVKKAVQCYTGASEFSQSAQALFNLGWMHENGVGLKQDFHLAKRYYDAALEINKEAYLPVTLSLLKLRVRSAWNTLTRGSVHSIQDEPKVRQDWSLSQWISNFLSEEGFFADEELYDDLYDDTAGIEEYDEEGVVESVLIIGVTAALMFLLWWRQRAQHRAAENQQAGQANQQGQPQQQQQQQQAAAGGLGPVDGFPGWAAGGFGI